MAKYAGMKYIVITSKHHDGFCLFDASNSRYDSVNASPYGQDLLKDLSAACQRHEATFCTYYSIRDWHHPAQLPAKEENGKPVWNPTCIKDGQKAAYTRYMKKHLHTGYIGPVFTPEGLSPFKFRGLIRANVLVQEESFNGGITCLHARIVLI